MEPLMTEIHCCVYMGEMPCTCIVCKKMAGKGGNVSLHRIPPRTDPVKRQQWLIALNLEDDENADHHRVCN